MDAIYKNKKILVVDDTAFMRNALIKILTELGFSLGNITQAENGRRGLDELKKSGTEHYRPYDIIMSDWNMPSMTGIELLKNVRTSDHYYRDLPFVLITTDSEKEKVIEAVQYRVSSYIIKPVEIGSIEECLNSIKF